MASTPTDQTVREVREGLLERPRRVSSRFFYDHAGSELFERITRLPEYYPTRTEQGLLEAWIPAWDVVLHPAALVELGAGSARKTRVLLDGMRAGGAGELYVPVDVSASFLRATARRLRKRYPELEIAPEVGDITEPLRFSRPLPAPTLFALLGSTIGNFDEAAAVELLGHVREAMSPEDRFLLGADLRPGAGEGGGKTKARLEAAYNDSLGVTAAFNLNMLKVLNRDFGTDFRLDRFRHRAFYAEEEGRIEMHLVSLADQDVALPGGGATRFRRGETLRTEISCKYDRPTVDALFDRAGLRVERWAEDGEGLYALILAEPV